jgi:hypothetical protein
LQPTAQPQQPEKRKTVEVVPPIVKPLSSVEAKPVRKITPAPLDWTVISSRVVFVPLWLRFGIEYSTWHDRQLADSAAAYLERVTRRLAFVEFAGKKNGRASYRIILGGYVSRESAAKAVPSIRRLLRSSEKKPPPPK